MVFGPFQLVSWDFGASNAEALKAVSKGYLAHLRMELETWKGADIAKWNQLNNCRAKFSPTFFEHIVNSVAFVSLRYSVLNEKRILKMLDTPFVWDTCGYNEGGGFGGSWSLLIAYLLECKIGHPQTVGPLGVDGSCFLEHVFLW